MLVMASERWATTARIYARGQKHGRPNGTMERGAIVARTLHDRGGNLAGPPIQLTTVKYQACTRTQNRIVLGTSREHMLEFA